VFKGHIVYLYLNTSPNLTTEDLCPPSFFRTDGDRIALVFLFSLLVACMCDYVLPSVTAFFPPCFSFRFGQARLSFHLAGDGIVRLQTLCAVQVLSKSSLRHSCPDTVV